MVEEPWSCCFGCLEREGGERELLTEELLDQIWGRGDLWGEDSNTWDNFCGEILGIIIFD